MNRAPTLERIEFRGWQAIALANEVVRLVAVPDIGGRVMAYDLGDHPFLFVDPTLAGKLFTAQENQGDGSMDAWKNYGGDKTWPAPQGWDDDTQWHGPPDPVLDTGRYTVDEAVCSAEEASITLASPPDTRTGIQIQRRFRLGRGTSRVKVELGFRNISDRVQRWSIWDVMQLDASRRDDSGALTWDPTCSVTTPLNPESRFEQGFNVMFGDADNPQWRTVDGLFRADYLWQIGKVGIDSQAGWVAFSQGSRGLSLIETFAVDPDADYPDGGATVECWTVGAGRVANLDYAESDIYLMEAEVLSPLYTIAPGDRASFSLEWTACHCPGAIVDVQPAGCWAVLPQAVRVGDSVHVRGTAGVFDVGELVAEWGDVRTGLGRVSPMQTLLLDQRLHMPEAAGALKLLVRSDADGVERLLALIDRPSD